MRFWICRSAIAPSDAAEKTGIYCRCTTTNPHVHKNHKDFLGENLLPVWLLVCTNLFTPSRFWTTYMNFDTCCQHYISTCRKNLYRCTSTFSALSYCSGIFSNPSAIYTKCAQKLFRRFLDFSQFLTAISRNLWRHLATKMRIMYCLWNADAFKKMVKTASKLTNKPLDNTCLNYVAL